MGRIATQLAVRVITIAFVAGMTATPASATSSSLRVWSRAGRIDSAPLSAISCPSATLCVAVDTRGVVLVSTDPGSAVSWRRVSVDSPNSFVGVSCGSPSLCVAVDDLGRAVVSTNPTSGSESWKTVQLANRAQAEGIACPSSSLCVALSDGEVLTSRHPATDPGPWAAAALDSQAPLTAVSCASETLCAAVDTGGNVLTSTDPTGGPSAWQPPPRPPYYVREVGVSCPSNSLCVTVNSDGYILNWNPASSALPHYAHVNFAAVPSGVWCDSARLCFAFDSARRLFATNDPTGPASAWSLVYSDVTGTPLGITGVACPSAASCVAVDHAGNLLVGGPPPTRAQIASALRGALTPSGRAAIAAHILRSDGYTYRVRPPIAGKLVISWYGVAGGNRNSRMVLLGRTTPTATTSGITRARVVLSERGRRILAIHNRMRVVAVARFTMPGAEGITVRRAFSWR